MNENERHTAETVQTDRPFVTVREAARILGKEPRYIYDQVKARRIKYYKPNGGRLLFARHDIEAFRRDCMYNGGRIYEPHTVTVDFYTRCGRRGR